MCVSIMYIMIVPLIEKDLEILVVKIFSWFVQTTKIKNTKYILQRIITIARTFLSASLHR